MLKAAIEKIVSLAAPTTYVVEGKTFCDQQLYEVKPREYHADAIRVSGLDSICKLIRNELPKIDRQVFVRVDSYKRVSVFSTYDDRFIREEMYICDSDTPGPATNSWMSQEQAIIQLQSQYIPSDDTTYLVKVLSSITKDSSVTSNDNGVTQTVEARKGVALKEPVTVKPIVNLTPFRTFLEVEQPASRFLFRINENGDVMLKEADGGAWRLEATRNIAAYFEDNLKDMIEAGIVVVIR